MVAAFGPGFGIEGGVGLALARAASVAGLLSVFGSLVFGAWVLPRAAGRLPAEAAARLGVSLGRLAQAGVAAGLVAMLVWLVLQAGDMAGAGGPGEVLAAMPVVVARTRFGHLIVLQLTLLSGTGVALGRRPRRWRGHVALGLATAALLLQAGHGHAASMYARPSVLLAAEAVHLLGAGAWLGGLLPLLVVVRQAPPKAAAMAARWFSPLGKLCLVALSVSAAYQGWVLSGGVAGVVGTAYGWMLLVKFALFGVLFGFAVANRYRFAPALLGGRPEAARRVLARSIAVQTGFGLAVVGAAGVLSALPPGMHLQPVWPFGERFTLETIGEDPGFRNEVLGALLALAGAAVLVATALLLRGRWRWGARGGAALAALAIAWLAVPHLDLLFVPAYPTSFYHTPSGFAATSIVEGAALFPQHCAACHGAEGRGDGPAAAGLPVPPADLTAAHLWMHEDGELFWWLTHGIEAPDGGVAMPGFAATLSEDQRWAVIDYVRAHNAGFVLRAGGVWSPPLQAPALQAACDGGRTVSLADLRGRFVRVVIAGAAPVCSDPGLTTILATSDPTMQPAAGLCVARDAAVATAYAIVAGQRPGAGMQVLIDGNGWLRAVQPSDAVPGWNDRQVLLAELKRLAAHPIAADAGVDHAHMQM